MINRNPPKITEIDGITEITKLSVDMSRVEAYQGLKWKTLEYRRIQNSFVLLYKIKASLVDVDHHHLTEIIYI